MEIGNERTKPEEMEGIPHHFLGTIPPDHVMNVAEYKKMAEEIIEDIYERGKLPFLVGGTGLYIDAITKNFQIPKGEPDMEYRNKLEELSIDDLLIKLKEVDPEEYQKLKTEKNKRFIIRALEIYNQTGKPKSLLATKGESKYDSFKIAVEWPRDLLYKRINERTIYQVDNGMIPEVEDLIKKYDPTLPAMTSIGCKEVIPFLNGEISKEEMIQTLQQNNRNYAKRQMTWFKRDPEIHWLDYTSL